MTDGPDHRGPAGVHHLLGNQRRLLIIRYLSLFAPGATVEVRHVARVVRGIEVGKPPRQVSTADYESAYNGLIQRHLPKLAETGLIEYDEGRKQVTVTQQLNQSTLIIAATSVITN